MIPYGYCHCGCGEKTNLAKKTINARGIVAGEPFRFIKGHNNRSAPERWREEDRGHDTPCWIWQWHTVDGYGRMKVGGRSVLAHRHNYEEKHGPIPDGLVLDHQCEVRACVNPDHVKPVTNEENVRRGKKVKLTMELAQEIRAAAARGECKRAIAETYGVCRATVSHIHNNRSWREAI